MDFEGWIGLGNQVRLEIQAKEEGWKGENKFVESAGTLCVCLSFSGSDHRGRSCRVTQLQAVVMGNPAFEWCPVFSPCPILLLSHCDVPVHLVPARML